MSIEQQARDLLAESGLHQSDAARVRNGLTDAYDSVWVDQALRAITKALTQSDARNAALEEAAKVAEKVAAENRERQRSNLGSSSRLDMAAGAMQVAAALRTLIERPTDDR